MARLVIFDESVRGVDLAGQPLVLGRSRRADVPIRDRLLSRKHCTIVPVPPSSPRASGFRVIDLKSSNGTFLNGAKVDEKDLEFDDILEIGSTVLVILKTDAWRRGQTLPRLRNLAKAEELIRAIRKREVPETAARGAGSGGRPATLRQKRALTAGESAFLEWAAREWRGLPASRELIRQYLSYQLVTLVLRRDAALAEALSTAMERVLRRENFEGGIDRLEEAIRAAVEEALRPAGPEAGVQ